MIETVLEKFNRIREDEWFCDSFDDVELVVGVERWNNAETFAAAEVPRFTSASYVVDGTRASDGARGSGIKIGRTLVVFPGEN